MIIEKLECPIKVINISEMGVNANRFISNIIKHYDEYIWDYYLLRQNQIEFLKNYFNEGEVSNKFWKSFYLNELSKLEIENVVNKLSQKVKDQYLAIKKTRKRLVSEFELIFDNEWSVKRMPSSDFSQDLALISENKTEDYRLIKRKFKEMPDFLDCYDMRLLLKGIAEEIRFENKKIKALRIIVHHTKVFCYPNQIATNSPEGIHQDGMDYIVSALVVERQNIIGGKSIIYGNDKKTEVLQTLLQSGQGILQPDRNSDLWHEVTAIECADNSKFGYRSTIGFDVEVIEK
ncbi:2OG-Fe dioxygenase family protein [Aquimarina sp. I32.4]|uniref:2OG-Fe dioxygenase family protein n=1 Tax=Aquimarina sp. I32.4 TaxID=2053903 RepID=UPI000CDEA434|nr:2OG-Fe dioxygenase family protein [Aquimarina sp. I32.4]